MSFTTVTAATLQTNLPFQQQDLAGGFSCSGVTAISQAECNALVAIYQNTNGPGWLKNDNWLLNNNPCTWHGIACTGGHVQTIGLFNNTLVGQLPDVFAVFPELILVSVHFNQLTGPIPASLGDAPKITILRLDNNQFSGTLPRELARLSLTRINVNNNQLEGGFPIEFLTIRTLEHLVMANNHFTGEIPATISRLNLLSKLWITGNQFTGTLPSSIGDMTNLEELMVSHNQFSGEIPQSVTKLTNLVVDPERTNFGYNRFVASNSAVRSFLNVKDEDWETTQTVPPTNLVTNPLSQTEIELTWTPILYTADAGYYEIYYSTSPNGEYLLHGTTANKLEMRYVLGKLTPSTTYYIKIRTYSFPHTIQQNYLRSEDSIVVSGTTLNPIVTDTHTPTHTPTYTPTPSHTPTHTPTSTPTSTATATPSTPSTPPSPTPTATNTVTVTGGGTPMPCGQTNSAIRTECINYLPVVLRIEPTATPTRRWQRFTNVPGYLDTVAILNGQIHAGSRGQTISDDRRGLYRLDSCAVSTGVQVAISRQGIYDLAGNGAQMLAATRGNRVYYADVRNNWQRTDAAIHNDVFAVTFVPGTNLAYAGAEDGLYVSTDAGFGWSRINGGPTPVSELLYDNQTGQLLIATLDGGVWIYRRDNGRFEEYNQGLPTGINDRKIWDVASLGEHVFIATSNGVYRSSNRGNWQPIGLQGNKIATVTVIAGSLYAGLDNAGIKWAPLTDQTAWQSMPGFPSITARAIVEDTEGLCATTNPGERAILVATDEQVTDSGLWIYR